MNLKCRTAFRILPMRASLALLPALLLSAESTGKTASTADTVQPLTEVVVKGFGKGRSRLEVPASVSVIRGRDLQRFSNLSLVPVVNMVPGVRMEERSPGSYRLSIRGSLLRSPFGVRNVKVYRDDYILTDAGGNTYLNLLDLPALEGMEIMKGPVGSIYGTGTGGVVDISGPETLSSDSAGRRHSFNAQLTGGSFGQFSSHAGWKSTGANSGVNLLFGHFQSDGYRRNSAMRRDYLQADVKLRQGEKSTLGLFLLAADLDYRTPGGLTQAQMDADPRQARPATAVLPSAESQRIGVRNRSLIFGISDRFRFSSRWEATTAVTGMLTDFRNPFITNYEARSESNLGIRGKVTYTGSLGGVSLRWISGGEWQRGAYRIDSSGNKAGIPDNNLARDRVDALQRFAFTQAEWDFGGGLSLHTAVSLNGYRYFLERVKGVPALGRAEVPFRLQAAPRLALSWRLREGVALHASTARGFSPPSVAEVRPSAGGFSRDLQAEHGWSHEIGLKGSAAKKRLQFDFTAFRFDLRDAIVRRTNAAGAEYFVNAGGTRQTGIELFVDAYPVRRSDGALLRMLRLWSAVTLSDFSFREYAVGNTDVSGKALTGVPGHTVTSGLDADLSRSIRLSVTQVLTGRLPLTDANDAWADASALWQARMGFRVGKPEKGLEIFAGADNITDIRYSLGNDLNAFGRRYFNPAPGRGFYVGLVGRF